MTLFNLSDLIKIAKRANDMKIKPVAPIKAKKMECTPCNRNRFNFFDTGGNTPPPSVFDADYQAILDYATAQSYPLPAAPDQIMQNDLVVALKAAGAWTEFDALYIMARAGSVPFAFINWVKPGIGNLQSNTPGNVSLYDPVAQTVKTTNTLPERLVNTGIVFSKWALDSVGIICCISGDEGEASSVILISQTDGATYIGTDDNVSATINGGDDTGLLSSGGANGITPQISIFLDGTELGSYANAFARPTQIYSPVEIPSDYIEHIGTGPGGKFAYYIGYGSKVVGKTKMTEITAALNTYLTGLPGYIRE
jgi:hypothetical protein